jgi:hypothetical protein
MAWSRLLALALSLTGCAATSTVTLPNGATYSVRCQRDAAVEFAQGDLRLRVDNRGKPGVLEQLLGTLALGFARAPEIAK